MTMTRRDAWTLSQNQVWPDTLVWYAKAVRAMQAEPIGDPTSWQYQAAIHGLAGTPPPAGAPWNECQHATWFFLPWHRMYLFQFESIVRAAVVAQGGPGDWALPYWNYEGTGRANQIPPAFRQPTMPDGSTNPLFVAARRAGVNTGLGLPPNVTSSEAAMAGTVYTTPTGGVPVGFGGPRTGFAHFGPAPGLLENQPHNIVHVAVGGPGGLMSDPDTAAQDPIFWLHHANIDRLWEKWRITTGANATTTAWLNRTFKLRDDQGRTVSMKVRSVLTTQDLGYTYDNLPVPRGRRGSEDSVPPRSRPRTLGQSPRALRVGPAGASTTVRLGELPRTRSTEDSAQRRFYLRLDDIQGRANPGVVYGVYVNLPDDADAATRGRHRVGTVSFFGIEHSTSRGSDSPQTLSYAFDATEVVGREGGGGPGGQVRVALVPDDDLDTGADSAGDDAPATRDAAPSSRAPRAATPTVTIGSVAIVTA